MDHGRVGQLLNGGYIEEYEFDIRNDRLSMRVDVLDDSELASYELRFEKVSSLLYDNESNRKEDRLQFTEIGFKEIPSHSSTEEWRVIISVWDTTHITVRCSVIEIDGQPVR